MHQSNSKWTNTQKLVYAESSGRFSPLEPPTLLLYLEDGGDALRKLHDDSARYRELTRVPQKNTTSSSTARHAPNAVNVLNRFMPVGSVPPMSDTTPTSNAYGRMLRMWLCSGMFAANAAKIEVSAIGEQMLPNTDEPRMAPKHWRKLLAS